MSTFHLLLALHNLAALVWVGGMFFAWMILRPAAVSALQAPERLRLWLDVFPRFFVWVWAAVLILPVSGVGLLHMGFGGFAAMPMHVQLMIGLYLVMLSLFLRVQLLLLPPLRHAVEAADWPAGGAALGAIRRMVGANLLVGLLLVAIAVSRLNV